MNARAYILAVSKPWVLQAFEAARHRLPGEWSIVRNHADLEAAAASHSPRYIFFPHWSELVPREITENFECVCFHMTDLPFGRGGSPLQNLIAAGHSETMLTALRMTDTLDAGPIYAKRPLSLAGSASEIFSRAAPIVCELIQMIVETEPQPTAQSGTPTHFRRRRPDDSRLPADVEVARLYDHIRMLDAPGYPKAFVRDGPWRVEFDQARLGENGLEARAVFSRDETSE